MSVTLGHMNVSMQNINLVNFFPHYIRTINFHNDANLKCLIWRLAFDDVPFFLTCMWFVGLPNFCMLIFERSDVYVYGLNNQMHLAKLCLAPHEVV